MSGIEYPISAEPIEAQSSLKHDIASPARDSASDHWLVKVGSRTSTSSVLVGDDLAQNHYTQLGAKKDLERIEKEFISNTES